MNKIDINDACANNILFARWHRLVNRDQSGTYNRPIIVRFLNYNDRQMIWGKRMLLANSTVSLSENYATNIEHRRKLLYPVMKKSQEVTEVHEDNLKVINL